MYFWIGSQSIKDTEGTVIITVMPHSSSRNTPIIHNGARWEKRKKKRDVISAIESIYHQSHLLFLSADHCRSVHVFHTLIKLDSHPGGDKGGYSHNGKPKCIGETLLMC